MPDDEYGPDAIRILEGMAKPRARPTGAIAMSVHDALEAWSEGRLDVESALYLIGADDIDGLLTACDACEVPRPLAVRYPIEDGPGSSDRVELTLRVLIGAERSTVIVADSVTGQALTSEVVQHSGEASAAAAAVERAVRDGTARPRR